MRRSSLALRGNRGSDGNMMGRKILVAVDFGTTFSGIAWMSTSDTSTTHVVDEWPDLNYTDAKVPTTLLYDGQDLTQYRWGCSIDDSEPRHEWFKLDIDPTRRGGNSDLAKNYPSLLPLPSTHGTAPPERLVVDYLTALRQHLDQLLEGKMPLFTDCPKEYILTVPAVWSSKARDDTMTYAEAAGMGDKSRIHMVTEPEAAALSELSTRGNGGALNEGDIFTVCDAGGGTVDLISYHVDNVSPLRIREATPGSGKACGSIFLNRIFEQRLRDKLQRMIGWTEDGVVQVVKKFDGTVKRNFRKDKAGPFVFQIPGLRNLSDRNGRDLSDRDSRTFSGQDGNGWVSFSKEEMTESVFEPVIREIVGLVKAQIRRARLDNGQSLKQVLLVGGFGKNVYLRERLKEVLGPGVVVNLSIKPQTAVVRGALLRLLAETMPQADAPQVIYRIARTHCGTLVAKEYIEGQDEPSRKEPNGYFSSGYQVKTINWFLPKRSRVEERTPRCFDHFWEGPVANGPPSVIKTEVYECADDQAARYPGDGAYQIAEVTADFERSQIPEVDFPRVLGPDGQLYYYLWFKIEITYFSAKRTFVLVYQDRKYASIDVNWVHPPINA